MSAYLDNYRFTIQCGDASLDLKWDAFPLDLPAEYASTYEDISHSANISEEMDVLMGAMGPAMSLAAMVSPAVATVTQGVDCEDEGVDVCLTLRRGELVLHTMTTNVTVMRSPEYPQPVVGFDTEALLAEFDLPHEQAVTDPRFQRRWPQQKAFDQTWVGMTPRDRRAIETIAMTLTENVIAMFDQGIVDL